MREDKNTDILRHNNFGFIRLLFAVLVVVSHSPELIDGNRSREILTRIFGTLSFGEFAVDGFFLVSGYLITKSFQNSRSIGDYLSKRVLRIYPGFIVAFLISTLIVGPLAGGDLSQVSPLKDIVTLGLLGLPRVPGAFNGFPYPDINGSLWTIPYEFRCYLLVALFGCIATHTNRMGYAAIIILLASLYIVRDSLPELHYGGSIIGNLNSSVRLTFVFFIGSAFYVWRDQISYSHRGAAIATVSLVAFMFMPKLAEPALAVLGGYLIFWYAFACQTNFVSRAMDHTDPSYGLYLYAWPIQKLLILDISGISPWTVTAVTLPIGILMGLLSWYIIEKPALRYKSLVARLRKQPADRVVGRHNG